MSPVAASSTSRLGASGHSASRNPVPTRRPSARTRRLPHDPRRVGGRLRVRERLALRDESPLHHVDVVVPQARHSHAPSASRISPVGAKRARRGDVGDDPVREEDVDRAVRRKQFAAGSGDTGTP